MISRQNHDLRRLPCFWPNRARFLSHSPAQRTPPRDPQSARSLTRNSRKGYPKPPRGPPQVSTLAGGSRRTQDELATAFFRGHNPTEQWSKLSFLPTIMDDSGTKIHSATSPSFNETMCNIYLRLECDAGFFLRLTRATGWNGM